MKLIIGKLFSENNIKFGLEFWILNKFLTILIKKINYRNRKEKEKKLEQENKVQQLIQQNTITVRKTEFGKSSKREKLSCVRYI